MTIYSEVIVVTPSSVLFYVLISMSLLAILVARFQSYIESTILCVKWNESSTFNVPVNTILPKNCANNANVESEETDLNLLQVH